MPRRYQETYHDLNIHLYRFRAKRLENLTKAITLFLGVASDTKKLLSIWVDQVG